jgi:hypothetical protein
MIGRWFRNARHRGAKGASRHAALAVLLAALATPAAAKETIVQRDALGHRTGTIEVQPGGRAVFRDAQGRRTGTAEPGASGRTVLRDAQGRPTPTLAAGRAGLLLHMWRRWFAISCQSKPALEAIVSPQPCKA